MEFTLKIDLTNPDDAHPDRLSRYIRQAAGKVQSGHGNGKIRDIEGDFIGEFEITGEAER